MRIKKNGKVINLTESDLQRIVKRVLNEGEAQMIHLKDYNKSLTYGHKQVFSAGQKTGGVTKGFESTKPTFEKLDLYNPQWKPRKPEFEACKPNVANEKQVTPGKANSGFKVYFTPLSEECTSAIYKSQIANSRSLQKDMNPELGTLTLDGNMSEPIELVVRNSARIGPGRESKDI